MEEDLNEVLEFLCESVKRVIDSEKIEDIKCKQKIYCISSFLEFIKAGADIKVLPFEDGKATFEIYTK
jgi:hypothetical protein